MLDSVSAINFKANPYPAGNDIISRPGLYSKPDASASQAPKHKKNRFLKTLVGLVVAAIVIGGSLAAATKKGLVKPLAEGKTDAKFLEKVSDYAAKAGKWINENIIEKAPIYFEKLKSKLKPVEKAAEAV